MAARGHYLGSIIDDLDTISSRVRARCRLGWTDLNHVLEDFFKELLNIVETANLVNLNEERMNAPGLDLGDRTSPRKLAYQITSQSGASKINKTLEKIEDSALDTYDEIYVLVVGEKQSSYKLDIALMKRAGFKKRNIIGMTELASRIMSRDLETIRAVHDKLRAELRRITIELDVTAGEEAESAISGLVEETPNIQRSDASLLFKDAGGTDLFENREEAEAALDAFVTRLSKLPRMTREYLGWMFDNTDFMLGLDRPGIFGSGTSINADLVSRKHLDELTMRSDLRLLESWGFIDIDNDNDGTSPRINLYFPGSEQTNFHEAFPHVMKERELLAQTLFSNMNFTAFGPPPKPEGSDKGRNRKGGKSS